MPKTYETVSPTTSDAPTEERIFKVLSRIGLALEISVDRADVLVHPHAADQSPADALHRFKASAENAGIFLKETTLEDTDEAAAFISEGYPIVVAESDGTFIILDANAGRGFQATVVADRLSERTISLGEFQDLVSRPSPPRLFVAKHQFDCDSISGSPYHSHYQHHGEEFPPLRRFIGLLKLDIADIGTLVLFAFVGGVLTLATPLAVESLVNVVSWGTYMQPLIMLGLILLMCLGIAGILRILQKFVVELIQRRQFVRIVSDLAHRFPRANQAFLAGQYPRELANRVFDIMTIQKATNVLLLDGVSIVLTTILGLVLLAFYHPFLLGFDIILLISMISITWLLGRGGIRTAIDESATKYRVAHWLQDVIASPAVFKTGGGEALAIQRANQLTADYLNARKRQFNVVVRQSAFAISLQVIASTAVLALGGWLVIEGQLTLGQLVASELVVTVVVGAFAKAGKSLEKFYDVMAGVDKVGHLIDIPADPGQEHEGLAEGPAQVRWGDLVFRRASSHSRVGSATIDPGSRVAITGNDVDGRSDLARAIAGLHTPAEGFVQIGDFGSANTDSGGWNRLVGYAGGKDVFHGTLQENIDLARPGISRNRVRQVLSEVGLADAVLQLKNGIQTPLQTGGYPLSGSEVTQLVIARAIASQPKVVVIDGLLDQLAEDVRKQIWNSLSAADMDWSLIVVTNREDIAALCESQIAVRK